MLATSLSMNLTNKTMFLSSNTEDRRHAWCQHLADGQHLKTTAEGGLIHSARDLFLLLFIRRGIVPNTHIKVLSRT